MTTKGLVSTAATWQLQQQQLQAYVLVVSVKAVEIF
jgi:hypothetical protein